jgi:Type I restriction enzyme R protein N terminus (HSDR_N)
LLAKSKHLTIMENTLNEIRLLFGRGAFKNEEHIRVAVVCRILQELGWNIWNPEEVNLEFVCTPDEDKTKVDVALICTPLRPDVFIEVKGYGQIRSKLSDIERQLRDYNRNNTALFSIITDGAEWRFYNSQTGGEFSKKCFKVLNLLRESVEDVALNFKTLLKKSEIQNGNAERQSIAYLRLTQKQRLMEDLLPEARRKALEPPFPPLPKALVDLVKEQGDEVSIEEATAFISEFQERKPTPPQPAPSPIPIWERKEAGLKQPTVSGVRQLDPKNPGDIRFTKIIQGKFGFDEATGWTDLVKAGIKLAVSKGFPIQELQRRLTIKIKTEPFNDDGYRWDPELKLSIQGFEAKRAADNLYRLANLLKEELYIRFYWRENDDAAHPGEEGVIQWRP